MEQYAGKRLERCKFGDYKPVCKDCWVHCYSAGEREYMQEVMRWAGPRMLYIHPLYAIIHLIDSRNQPFSKNNLKKSL
jgi:hypothetical protein